MGPKLDQWTVGVCIVVLGGALLACKKDEEPAPAVSAAPVATPEPPKEEPKEEEKEEEPKEAKRYDDEKEEEGTVRVKAEEMKIYQEADTESEVLEELDRGMLVNRLARRGDFILIEYPSGPGELSPGWVEEKDISTLVEKVDPETVKKQVTKVVKTDAGKTAKTDDTKEDEKQAEEKTDENKEDDTATDERKRERRVRIPKKGVAPPSGGRPTPSGE